MGGRRLRAFGNVFIILFFGVLVPTLAWSAPGTHTGSSIVVTTADDTDDPYDEACSLREAIIAANTNADYHGCARGDGGGDRISFNISSGGPHVIALGGPLPAITGPVTIDGYTQPGASPNTLPVGDNAVLKVALDGGASESEAMDAGLLIEADNVVVRGLAIINIPGGSGITLAGGRNSVIEGSWIGVDASGMAAPNGGSGILISGGSRHRIGGSTPAARNIISANRNDGIEISGYSARFNSVQGNYIGTSVNGNTALGNQRNGVSLYSGARENIIGGTAPGAGNVISANRNHGVDIAYWGARDNLIQGNIIGLDAAGSGRLGNQYQGVLMNYYVSDNLIGGSSPAARNTISGNGENGVVIANSATRNRVQGNYIGTDIGGAAAVPNTLAGVNIEFAAYNNVIGAGSTYGDEEPEEDEGPVERHSAGDGHDDGDSSGAVNLIAGNGGPGVRIAGEYTQGNVVAGNSISANGGLGIDLGDDGVTPNDIRDTDSGPNGRQNVPVLTSAAPASEGVTIAGFLNSTPGADFTLQLFASSACDPSGYGEGATYLGSLAVTTNISGTAHFSATLGGAVAAGEFITATATGPEGTSEFAACAPVSIDNTAWTTALRLDLAGAVQQSASASQRLDRLGQARWYKFRIQPGAQVVISLSSLPANYDLVVYKDIRQVYEQLTVPQDSGDLTLLTAEFAPDSYSPDSYSPDSYSPDSYSPDSYSPDSYSPDSYSPDIFAPDSYSPDSYSPDSYSPDSYSPDSYSPDSYSPDSYSPDSYSPDSYSPDPAAYASAQLRSIVAGSGQAGLADELVIANTWSNTGDFYVRVKGRNGAFNLAATFDLSVTLAPGGCADVAPISTPSDTIASAGGFKTIILVDLGRMEGAQEEKNTLAAHLAALAARQEVLGVVVDVGADARVAAANAQADEFRACPYAKNLVAYAIKDIVTAYAERNPLEYVVIVGNDDAIPFVRYPDQAQLANETNYKPPVLDATASQASLRLGYVLGQDYYGAPLEIGLKESMLPLPGLAVGRLVETPADVISLIDAYLALPGGVAPAPQTALVTGYDFLSDAAAAVQAELTAGLGGPIDTLIADRELSPLDPRSWTAEQLRDALLNDGRHDLVFLAGHFSASSALAADYSTRLLASEVAGSTADFTNAIVFSAGCHAGYNIVNSHGVPGITVEPDWAQAFARKGATLIAGTGYQYGDTDFIEYGERLYLEFSRQLRASSGPVAVGKALAAAKRVYLSQQSPTQALHEKQYLISALFGLPMLSIDMPGARYTPPADASIVGGTTGYAGNPGLTLGLSYADVSITPGLATRTTVLSDVTNPGQSVIATYLQGGDGVQTGPARPVLPLETRNVQAPDGSLVLRGVGLRGGSYTDLPDIWPLTGAPVTELRGVRPIFLSNIFFPSVPWSVNYLDALSNPAGGTTQLALTPAQYLPNSPGAPTGTLRRFNTMGFRLFYSDNTGTYGANVPAMAAPPGIAEVTATADGGTLRFRARVTGDPAAGIQEVWVTYTATSGPLYGHWQSLDLAQSVNDSTIWEGNLPLGGTDAADIRYIAQAVNGVGLVALANNYGASFTPGVNPGDPPAAAAQPGDLALESPPTAGAYGGSASFTARLTSNGLPVSDQLITFRLAGQTRGAVTGADGRATATFTLLGLPGDYTLQATFAGTPDVGGATATAPFTINAQVTSLALTPDPATAAPGADSGMVATLTEGSGRRLGQQTVFFEVSGVGGSYSRSEITSFLGEAPLGALPLPPGSYTVNVYFADGIPAPGAQPTLADPRYLPAQASATLTIVQPDTTPPVTTASVAGTPAPACGASCFLGSATVTLAATDNDSGVAATFYRVTLSGGQPGAFQTYSAPFAISGEGGNLVEFYSTDNAGNTEAVQSITVTIVAGPATAVLDDFNRRDGKLNSGGKPWYGPEGLGGYSIRDKQVQVYGGGPIYWKGPSYGASQEAYMTLTKVNRSGKEQSLLLKVQGGTPNWRNGAIDVNLVFKDGQAYVRVDTYQPRNPGPFNDWRHYQPIPVQVRDGSLFLARAMADGSVRIYIDSVLVGVVDTTRSSLDARGNPTFSGNGAFFVDKGGRIGIWDIAASGARLDDFGGGTLP